MSIFVVPLKILSMEKNKAGKGKGNNLYFNKSAQEGHQQKGRDIKSIRMCERRVFQTDRRASRKVLRPVESNLLIKIYP